MGCLKQQHQEITVTLKTVVTIVGSVFSRSKSRLAAHRKHKRGRGWHLGAKREVLLVEQNWEEDAAAARCETRPGQRETGICLIFPLLPPSASTVTPTGPTSQGYLEASGIRSSNLTYRAEEGQRREGTKSGASKRSAPSGSAELTQMTVS